MKNKKAKNKKKKPEKRQQPKMKEKRETTKNIPNEEKITKTITTSNTSKNHSKWQKNRKNLLIQPLCLTFLYLTKLSSSCVSLPQTSGFKNLRAVRYISGTTKRIHTIDYGSRYRAFELTSTTAAVNTYLKPLFTNHAQGSLEGAVIISETESVLVSKNHLFKYDMTAGTITNQTEHTCETWYRFLTNCKPGGQNFFGCVMTDRRICIWSHSTWTLAKKIDKSKDIRQFSISEWAAPVTNRAYVLFDKKKIEVHEFETTTESSYDHSDDATVTSVSSNIALHKTLDLVVYAVNVTGNIRGRLMLRDRTLTTLHDSYLVIPSIITKVKLVEATSLVVFRADVGIICTIPFTATSLTKGSESCDVSAPASDLDFEVIDNNGSPNLLYWEQTTLALYSLSPTIAPIQIYNAQPSQVTKTTFGAKMEFHVFQSFYVREFDTDSRTYTAGEVYKENVYKSVLNPSSAGSPFSLIGKDQKFLLIETQLSDKTQLNSFDFIVDGLVTATLADYEGTQILDFCFSKTTNDHVFVLFIAWKKTDKQRTFFVAYYDLTSVARNMFVYTPTDGDRYSQIVHMNYQSTEKIVLVGGCFTSFTITYTPSFSLTLASNECLNSKNEWPIRTNVNVVNHDSTFDILVATSPNFINRYSPNPSVVYQEERHSRATYTNCLTNTINGRFYCGGNIFFSNDANDSNDNKIRVFLQDEVKGVIFQGFGTSNLYLQRGEGNQLKFNLAGCGSNIIHDHAWSQREKCLGAFCERCELATGNYCWGCQSKSYDMGSGTCIDTCNPKYYENKACVDDCPKYKYKFKDDLDNTECVTACDASQGYYPFGNYCNKCDSADKEVVDGFCRCKNNKFNIEGTSCGDSCAGYSYKAYDGMCVASLDNPVSDYQVSGQNVYCLKASEYYSASTKLCVSSCNSPNLKTETHPEFGKTCVKSPDTCSIIGRVKLEGTLNCILASECPNTHLIDSVTHECLTTCSNGQYRDWVARVCVTDCPSGYLKDPSTMNCVQTCPSDRFVDSLIKTCVTTCTGSQYRDLVAKTCVTDCPTSYMKDPNTVNCVNVCPANHFNDTVIRTCVTDCTGSQYRDLNARTCVTDCPSTYMKDPNTINCVNVCPDNHFNDTVIRTCVTTCTGDQYKDLAARTCVTDCPKGLLKDPTTVSCQEKCPDSHPYTDPSPILCVSKCPKKVNNDSLCYDEFEIIGEDPIFEPEQEESSFSFLLKLNETDQNKQADITRDLIMSVANRIEEILANETLNETNFIKVNQSESKIIIKARDIIDRCPLNITFNTTVEVNNPSNALFYTNTTNLTIPCSIVTPENENRPIEIKRSVFTGSTQVVTSVASTAAMLSGVSLVTPNANFLTYIAQTYSNLIFLTLINTRLYQGIEDSYLNIFRDLFDDLSVEGIKLIIGGTVESNVELVCQKQPARFCKTSALNNFFLSNFFNLAQGLVILICFAVFSLKSASSLKFKKKKKLMLIDTLPNFWLSNQSPLVFGLVNTISVFSTSGWFNSASTGAAVLFTILIILFLLKLILYTRVSLDKEWTENNFSKKKEITQEDIARFTIIVNQAKENNIFQEIMDENFSKTYRSEAISVLFVGINFVYDACLAVILVFLYRNPKVEVGCWIALEVVMTGLELTLNPFKERLMSVRTGFVRIMFILLSVTNMFLAFSPESYLYSMIILVLSVVLMVVDISLALYILSVDIYISCKNRSKKKKKLRSGDRRARALQSMKEGRNPYENERNDTENTQKSAEVVDKMSVGNADELNFDETGKPPQGSHLRLVSL